jgi:hypothetical protein
MIDRQIIEREIQASEKRESRVDKMWQQDRGQEPW